ncbi:MAG: accessory factor UbiK family protein [Acetobacteraceae bacterium]|nr:accessory factor UbiK family protein [Acetobacteraceae bacterium]
MRGGTVLDDLAGVAGGALSLLGGLRREMEAMARAAVEAMIRRLDLVTREEFEVVRELAQRAREENERLAARLAALEGNAPPQNDEVEGTAP